MLNLCNFVHSMYLQNSNFLQIQTIHTSYVHNFPFNLRNSRYLNFLQIQTIRTSNVQNFTLNLCNFVHSTYLQNSISCKSKQSEHLMYKISDWIYAILFIQRIYKIQIFCKSKKSIHLMYTISRLIYAILYI